MVREERWSFCSTELISQTQGNLRGGTREKRAMELAAFWHSSYLTKVLLAGLKNQIILKRMLKNVSWNSYIWNNDRVG